MVATVWWEPIVTFLGGGLILAVAVIGVLVWALTSEADARRTPRHRPKKD